MKNITRHVGHLTVIERLPSSRNGNPRYRCSVDGYTFTTTPDSSYSYSITNHDGKLVTVELGTHHNKLQLNAIWSGDQGH